MPVQMALKRIILSDIHESHYIELKELHGERRFTIIIGRPEAMSINQRVKRIASPRPMTHDLVIRVMHELGGELRDIVISDLREGTYFAKLRVMHDGELQEIDCRPSDAIAVATTMRAPIYVEEDVLEEASA